MILQAYFIFGNASSEMSDFGRDQGVQRFHRWPAVDMPRIKKLRVMQISSKITISELVFR